MKQGEYKALFSRMGAIIKRDFKTIPNILCYFRIIIIPIFIWVYIGLKNYTLASILIILSGITDVLDGFIARRFNMVSDLGKALDPAADKLTQVSIFICLSSRYRAAWLLVLTIIIRELTLLMLGVLIFHRKNTVNGAKWYGKLATVVTVASAFLLIVFPMISDRIANIMIITSTALSVFSFIMYLHRYLLLLRSNRSDTEGSSVDI